MRVPPLPCPEVMLGPPGRRAPDHAALGLSQLHLTQVPCMRNAMAPSRRILRLTKYLAADADEKVWPIGPTWGVADP